VTVPFRVLLLAMVAFGMLQMHSLGHGGTGHEGRPAVAMAEHSVPADPEPGPAPEPDPLAVCLAVLGALALAAPMLVRLVYGALRRDRAAATPAPSVRPGRGPPLPVPPLGRQLASLSVLRI
jgi:hypothetical protein